MKKIQIIGHRGARAYAAENTLPAYKVALEMGVDVVDMDVVVTKDGILVAYHDLMINPDILCDSDGEYLSNYKEQLLIKDIILADLKEYQVKLNPDSSYGKWFPKQKIVPGTSIPTLQEIVDYVNKASNNTMQFQIEIKNDLTHPEYTYAPDVLAKTVYDFLSKNNLGSRVKIQAFDWRILYALNQFDANIKTAYLESYDTQDNWQKWFRDSVILDVAKSIKIDNNWQGSNVEATLLHLIKALGGYSYEPEDNELTYVNLMLAHDLGLKVFVWGWPEHSGFVVNAELVTRLAHWSIDGFTTDDPLKVRNILQSLNTAR